MKQYRKYLVFILLFSIFFTEVSHTIKVMASSADPVMIKNLTLDSDYDYSGSHITYIYNGIGLDLNKDYGIIAEDGSALGPMTEIFQKNLHVVCSFDLKTQKITLQNTCNTIDLFIGSTKAIVNGVEKTMDVAPQILQLEGSTPQIFVPTRFVAENLGFTYFWNSTAGTVTMEQTHSVSYKTNLTETSIAIPLFEDTTLDEIYIDDRYYDGEIAIYLPGNHQAEYEDNVITNRYSAIKNIDVTITADNRTEIIFCTSSIRACTLDIKNGYLNVTLADPDDVYSKIVIIDPGHGGKDTGAIRESTYEKDYNLLIAYENTKDLFAASDIKVYYTRVTDFYSTIDTRAAMAAKIHADLYVSLHQNTNNNTSIQGTSVYYSSLNNPTLINGLSSKVMAGIFRDNIIASLNTVDYGVINHSLTVTTNNTVPSILIELAFMSNTEDLARLNDPEFQKNAGKVLFDTVKQIFDTYPTGR